MKKIFILVALASVILLGKSAYADQYGCNGQYGGYGSNCSTNQVLIIDKTVGKPTNVVNGAPSEYVDNLSSSDPRFQPGNYVYFQLKVKNTSDQALSNVTVKDILPQYISAVEGPGTYNKDTNVIQIDNLSFSANEQKTFTLKTLIASQDKITTDQTILCLVNKAEATSSNLYDSDSAQFCIEKTVTNVVKVPATGPEMGIELFLGEASLLGAGLYLKKKLS